MVGTKAKGRLWRLYDTAGELELTEYDFKGNILEMSKTLPDDFTADEDWTGIAAETNLTDLNTFVGSKLSGDTYALERTFDALNQLLTETGPDAEIGGSGAASLTTYTYDKGSRLKTVEVAVRGASATTFVSGITYNARGQRLTIVKGDDATSSPTTGDFTTTTYTYNANRLWLTDLLTTRDSDSATLQDLPYTRDAVGNITQIDDAVQSTLYHSNTQVNRQRTFTYDALYRLTEATGREKDALAQPGPSLPTKYAVPAAGAQDALMWNYTQTYFYDEAGNLIEMKHVAGGSTLWRRGYDLATGNNQVLKSSEPGDTFGTPSTYSSSYSYNRRGAMVFLPHLHNNAGADNLVRDYRDQLREALLNANDSAFYVYDAAGNRVAKSVEGGQNRYVTLYLWSYEAFQEIESPGPTVKEERHTLHVMDDVNRICLVESRTIQSSGSYTHAPTPLCRFQFDDHLGTACVETDVDMAVISYEDVHPYGTTAWWSSDNTVDKHYRFTGKERDEETGLSYHGQRYLITWLGRWERADPIGLGDGGNRHGYASGRPLAGADPTGLLLPALVVRQMGARSLRRPPCRGSTESPAAASSCRGSPRQPRDLQGSGLPSAPGPRVRLPSSRR